MKHFFNKIWRWIVVSSADPRRTSLMVKGLLLGIVTQTTGYILQALDIVCEFGYKCYTIDPTFLDTINSFIDMLAESMYIGLMLASSLLTAYGTLRKLWRTATSKNLALK